MFGPPLQNRCLSAQTNTIRHSQTTTTISLMKWCNMLLSPVCWTLLRRRCRNNRASLSAKKVVMPSLFGFGARANPPILLLSAKISPFSTGKSLSLTPYITPNTVIKLPLALCYDSNMSIRDFGDDDPFELVRAGYNVINR